MTAVVIDTHVLLWYLFEPKKLSMAAVEAIEQCLQLGNKVGVSTISIIEIIYLTERNRLPKVSLPYVCSVLADAKREFQVIPVDFIIASTLQHINRVSIPEMPDRIIATTAVALGVPLITSDHIIQASGIQTIW